MKAEARLVMKRLSANLQSQALEDSVSTPFLPSPPPYGWRGSIYCLRPVAMLLGLLVLFIGTGQAVNGGAGT